MEDIKKKGNLTIKTVARFAGVSVATAARAMGGYGSISEDTRQRVMRAAEELNYVPNAIAQSMRRQSTKTIGVIVGDIQASFFSNLIYTIEEVANHAGYNVLICNTNEQVSRELVHLKSLYARRVDGIILSSSLEAGKEIQESDRHFYSGEIPIVLIDRKVDTLNRPIIQCDNVHGSYKAAKYLLELGHRNIGVIATKYALNSTKERVCGFRMALEEYGVEYNPCMVRYSDRSYLREEGRLVTQRLLDQHPDITALYILNNPLYKSAWFELKERGLKIPSDISVLGWGDIELAEAWNITVVTQPVKQIGIYAAETLFNMIHYGSQTSNTVTTLETTLIHRESCARPGR